ncbi:hypothetical protein GCM10027203_67740 [Nonomuraea fastidiosa]
MRAHVAESMPRPKEVVRPDEGVPLLTEMGEQFLGVAGGEALHAVVHQRVDNRYGQLRSAHRSGLTPS